MGQKIIDEGLYEGSDDIDRYIRINPRRQVGLDELTTMLGHRPCPVKWHPVIYSLPSTIKIACCPAYQNGNIYGIDVSSAAAGELFICMQ